MPTVKLFAALIVENAFETSRSSVNNSIIFINISISLKCFATRVVGFPGFFTLLTLLRNTIKYTWCGCFALSAAHAFAATPNMVGQSGYVNMPK